MAADLASVIDRWAASLRARGLIERWHVATVVFNDALRITVDLPGGAQPLHAEIGAHELRMGGVEAVRFWLHTIEDSIEAAVRHERRSRLSMARSAPPAAEPFAIRYGYRTVRPEWFGVDFAAPARDQKAEQRAAELFRIAAGKEAFAVLNADLPLPITGSGGTRYTLHKRAAYCVERVKDGAKLCAVVPGVPLWDHLLGVKLMVEHDEPKFLKTANVIGDARSGVRFFSWT